ncbi:MAG: hypothetical protein BECKG1743D_GA0114223_100582 [Candidatus Kentron sp. G]|nr:MAG: hypothetical protein BECKG1743D_GA0114223_100582 [Candidatus Kentron sp. G]VFN02724.1 MAG: hypothetical protein BECKG1743E_GA0114224_105352 [Candidatus Kentron sp. G]VFN02803.1 MAG: hypothetical protein BECKG1743F_GA0114225_107271 [Candidatus Kentron sp. G]
MIDHPPHEPEFSEAAPSVDPAATPGFLLLVLGLSLASVAVTAALVQLRLSSDTPYAVRGLP